MVTPNSIESSITSGIACDHCQVSGDGQHFEAVIVSAAFDGLTRIRRHQLVYAALGDRLCMGYAGTLVTQGQARGVVVKARREKTS